MKYKIRTTKDIKVTLNKTKRVLRLKILQNVE